MKKIKIEKESLKTIISSLWWVFIIVPLVISSVFIYLFSLMDKPKNNEKIRIFSGFTFSETMTQQIYNEYRNEFLDYGILEAGVYVLNENSTTYALNFGDVTFKNYELIIASLDEYNIDKGIFNNSCFTLDIDYYGSNFDYFYNEDKPIGVKIFDEDDEQYNQKFTFLDHIGLTKNTYIFVSNKSSNSKRLIDNVHSLNELALKTFLSIFVK